MTLVIGSVESFGVRLICDSQISDRNAIRDNVIPGRLKLILLGPQLCAGFAGQPDIAIDAIREIAANEDFEQVTQSLLDTHTRTEGRVDFLTAAFDPPRLEKISDGRRYSGGRQYWIGDAEAANVFSGILGSVPQVDSDNPDYAIAGRIHQAFAQLLRDERAPGVGGLSFTVAPNREGFRYAPEAGVFFPGQTIPSGIATVLRFGGPAQGGYAFSIYTSNTVSVAAVGVYFLQGRCGVLYMPLQRDEAEWFSDVSQDEFRDIISLTAGVPLVGITLG